MRKFAAIVALVTLVAVPTAAYAQGSADTAVTFAVAGGTLDVTAPASIDIGTVTPGTPAVGQSGGPVSVQDGRNLSPAGWTLTASRTNPVGVTLTQYLEQASGVPAKTGTGCSYTEPFTGTQLSIGPAPTTLATASGCQGTNTYSVPFSIQLTVATGAFAGNYSLVHTHAVS